MKSLPVLYEDDDIIVINKPFGLAVQGGSGVVNSVDTLLAAQRSGKVYPVHRLDKDTSGALIVAKTARAAGEWAAYFAAGKIVKEYAAVCVGKLPAKSGVLETPAGKKGEKKSARTEYRVETVLEFQLTPAADKAQKEAAVLSVVRLTLKTGRTHQIRQQLAAARCPVAADDKYGDFAANRCLKKTLGITKLQLAAVRLILPARGGGEARVITAELPSHMKIARGGRDLS
jgi:23S rRNA pseudouridine955/2504/2580 synthase